MNTFGYILNSVLVLVVLLQLRERRLDRTMILLPLVLVGVAAAVYLHSVPTAGNDLTLILALTVAGAAMGGLAGALTVVRGGQGSAYVRASYGAAIVWILGVGARMGFAYAADHGAGASIAHFSRAHQITGGPAWTAALVLMGLATVLARVGLLYLRGRRVAPLPIVPDLSGRRIV